MAYSVSNTGMSSPKGGGGGKKPGGGKGKFSAGNKFGKKITDKALALDRVMESPFKPNKPTTQRKYEGGEIISSNLPATYVEARGENKQCSNCYFNKKGYCTLWEAKIKAIWVCVKWAKMATYDNLIVFEKQAYGSRRVSNTVTTEFLELTQNNKKDLTTFFNLYDSLFFDIPKEGVTSHETIVKRSKEYLNNFIDPKDATIEALQDEIENLNNTLLNSSLEGAGNVTNNLDQFDNLEDIKIPKVSLIEPDGISEEERRAYNDNPELEPKIGQKVIPTPAGQDTNNDGINDEQQQLSSFGTIMLKAPQSSNLTRILSNPNAWYYKPQYYGKPVYAFRRKLPYGFNGVKNLLVVNLGAKNQGKFRFLKVMDAAGTEFRIPKKFWTSRNTYPSGKETGAAGYLLEEL